LLACMQTRYLLSEEAAAAAQVQTQGAAKEVKTPQQVLQLARFHGTQSVRSTHFLLSDESAFIFLRALIVASLQSSTNSIADHALFSTSYTTPVLADHALFSTSYTTPMLPPVMLCLSTHPSPIDVPPLIQY